MDFSAVSFALETIAELTQQVSPLLGVEDQVESLETELRWMQSFLKLADARTVDNEVIRTSVAEIRELAYDVEDVIETFALKIASKRKGGFSNCIKRSACFFKEVCLLHRTRSEIEKITARIEVLTRRLKTYDVAKLGDHGEEPSPSTERREARRPFPHKIDDNIVGMEGDINKLVPVLVEERNECRVASICGMGDRRGYLHELQCLSNEQSWELFQMIAFPQIDPTENRVDAKLKELGEEMVKRCAGLPLAIVVLGGILVTKDNSLNEWLKISENVKSYLKMGKSEGPEDVLALSYDDLPPYLRPCFLYLSHFPEDYEISVDRLIQLWVAEGIVSSKHEERYSGEIVEDVAERYLMELVERCTIQVRERDVKIKTIKMHDLMRDLCLSKAKQESFVFIVDQSNASSLSIIRKARRVSSHKSFRIQCIQSPNLRSLMFFDKFIPDVAVEKHGPKRFLDYVDNNVEEQMNPLVLVSEVLLFVVCLGVLLSKVRGIWRYMCSNFKLLRVLNYEERFHEVFEACKLLNDIGNLIHLRFLSLRGLQFRWRKLPSSLGNLMCLQTLDLRLEVEGLIPIHVPNVIWRMEKLRHLYLPMKCNHKTKLKLDTLSNLQTLVNFNSKTCYIKDLINMTNLRELEVRGPFEIKDFNADELDKNPPIIEGRHLHSLSIINDEGGIDPRHLNHLLSSCLSLCKLRLDVEISEVPKYDHLSSILARIKLRGCKLEEDPMPTLEKLPNLRTLELHHVALIANKIICSAQGFPKLECLELKQLPNLKEWNVDEGAMPCLRQLEIDECLGLKMVPDGLRRMCHPKLIVSRTSLCSGTLISDQLDYVHNTLRCSSEHSFQLDHVFHSQHSFVCARLL
ncbi:hypothetical protein V6N11_016586 [Hibiscus sabdariffa]|uniref:Uncharacterized protein n=1 Tax=Hibiscus sabdariffa TaxID=183260 RepID=A0ABR2TVD9_9ROSI